MQETLSIPFSLPQQRILLTLAELFYCTNTQLCRRWYKPGCIRSIWGAIAVLERQGLIAHDPRLLNRSDGRPQRIYYLTTRGRRAVEAMGGTIPLKHLPGGNKKYIYQEHTLAVNNFHCAVHEFAREDPAVEVVTALPDAVLKRDPLSAALEGKPVRLVPDTWLHLHAHGSDYRFWVEVDRGTEEETEVRKKIAAIIRAQKAASEKWGGAGFRALYLITPADPRTTNRRGQTILTWMEKELKTLGKPDSWGAFFVVAGLDTAAVSGTALFTAPYFVSPIERTAKALVTA